MATRTPASPTRRCWWRRVAAARRGCRCGSCARPGARSPSTGRCAARAASSTPSTTPTLSAEITLQPVRRYGVDAAILYSDIVVPAAAIGFGVDVTPGVGPVVTEPFRSRRRPRPAAPLRARRRRALRRRDRAPVVAELGARPLIGFAGAPFTVASYLIEGRPSRTYGLTKAMLHGEPTLWSRAARPAGRHGHRLAARPGRRRAPAPSSCSTPGPARCRPTSTREHVLPAQRQGVRGARGQRRAAHPLRRGHRRAARAHGRRRRRRRRRRLAGAARRGARAGARARPCRATSTRPCAWRRGTSWPTAPATCCAATPAAPATSSTSATACSPSSTPAC